MEYNSEWWKPVKEQLAYEWEVLPQAADKGEVILSKRHELGLLSNFADTPFTLDGVSYSSIEGFWQMMKYPESMDDYRSVEGDKLGLEWKSTRKEISQMLGFDAVALGDLADLNMEKLNINWVTYQEKRMDLWTDKKGEHYKLILRATLAKLKQNPLVYELLMETQGLKLLPDHHQPNNAPPSWRYYQIYMDIRDGLIPLNII